MHAARAKGSSARSVWQDASADSSEETVVVKRWRDAVSGQMMEEVEPVPAPPQGDFRRSADGVRRKLSALLGRTGNPFEDNAAQKLAEREAESEQAAAEAEAEALAPKRTAEDVQRAYERGHAVEARLAQSANRRDAGAEQEAQAYKQDDRIHSLNVDALRIAADPALLKRGGTERKDGDRRGADGSMVGGRGAEIEYITSILKEAGLEHAHGLRGQEAATEAAAGAGKSWTRGSHKPQMPEHTQAQNAQLGELAGHSSGMAMPLQEGAVRKVFVDILKRTLAQDASASSSAAPGRSAHAASFLTQSPELLGRALLQALAEFAPAHKQREASTNNTRHPAKLAALEERLGKALLARADLTVFGQGDAGASRQAASAEDRVREVVLNTLSLKIAEALDACAQARQGGDYLSAAPSKPASAHAARAEPPSLERIAVGRTLLSALLGDDAASAAAARYGSSAAVLKAGLTWGESLQRLAREASADSDSGALFSIAAEDVDSLEARLLVALEEGVRSSERIAQAMLGNTTAEAPQTTHASPLSQEDRTLVAQLLALNTAAADGTGAPLDRFVAHSDAAVPHSLALHRALAGAHERLADVADPEALLRAWVLRGEMRQRDRQLAASQDALSLVQPVAHSDAVDEALEAAAALLRAKSQARAAESDMGVGAASRREGLTRSGRIEAQKKVLL
jgi:hypothetical protein